MSAYGARFTAEGAETRRWLGVWGARLTAEGVETRRWLGVYGAGFTAGGAEGAEGGGGWLIMKVETHFCIE